jgi:hypothetical protein
VGQGIFNSVAHYKEYTTWVDMFNRCYDLRFNPSYEGFNVCERWYSFQIFCEDIIHLKNYTEWKDNKEPRKWAIDKDILCEQLNIYPKIYSPETCMFITNSDNTKEMLNRRMEQWKKESRYMAINITTNETYEFGIISYFAKEHGIDRDEISKCIRGIRENYKGFKFKLKE